MSSLLEQAIRVSRQLAMLAWQVRNSNQRPFKGVRTFLTYFAKVSAFSWLKLAIELVAARGRRISTAILSKWEVLGCTGANLMFGVRYRGIR